MVVHIVEDDEAVADALAIVLGELNYHPAVYSDGETFLTEAEVSADDLVILDLGLPGMSGVEVARQLNSRTEPPRIIAISGKPQARLNRHMQNLPGMTVLRKPLSIETLADAVS
ncbi:response regulator [Labrenzia sp. PHM005]|uniref:response regulator n=1 Tax=Labrenzia sp. PHM005 TaxID=2590016 RepID=UPI00113FD0F3|nr:response regulator [Labrenzia sp. PHM005]QDG78791.1 response regulator [Labrenzia sp. PHM005]